MATVNEFGVTGTTLAEYNELINEQYLAIDPGWNINPESPDGQQIGIWSETLALVDEAVQFTYQSVDPNTAVGQGLDRIALFAGITRQDATFSTATVTLSGVNGTVVPAGSQIRNSATDTLWSTNAEATIPDDVGVTCDTAGANTAGIGDLSTIATPVSGWQSVTNAAVASIGLDEESDNTFRLRRNNSVALSGSNQLDNMFAAVADVEDVKRARIYENPTNSTDANGLEAHSIAIFADGGGNADIQQAIVSKKNPGCAMNTSVGFPNEVTANVTTPLGNLINITFFRPEAVTIYVDVDIANDTLPESAKDDIKQAIVDYSVDGFPGSGFDKTGFRIGEKVSAGKLYTAVNNIVGDQGYVENITVGTSPSPTGGVVAILFNQLGVFDTSNIEVTYT